MVLRGLADPVPAQDRRDREPRLASRKNHAICDPLNFDFFIGLPLAENPARKAHLRMSTDQGSFRNGFIPTPIPERERWALMLAGLALAGLLARRCRQGTDVTGRAPLEST